MFRMKDKSLVVTSSIVLALLLVIVIGVTEYLSYNTQKVGYYEEIDRIGETLGYQIEADREMLTLGYNEIAAGNYEETDNSKQLQKYLDAMVENDIVANAYIFMPEIVERDGKKTLIMLQSSAKLKADGLAP